jgi:putative ABC transport system permease protein
MTTSVIERRKEIGLMKSIGAQNQKIVTLFLLETIFIGIIGGILGYMIGVILSQFIGISVFSTTISPQVIVIPFVLGISIGVSLLASILPVRKAIKVEPAIVLRGE